MRTLLKFLVGPRAAWLPPGIGMLWALLILPFSLWALGLFTVPGFGAAEQSALSRALGSADPVEAIAAAEVIDAGFGNRMRDAIMTTGETFDRSGMLGPAAAALKVRDEAERGWVRRYVCGLKGWGDHRPMVRVLMLNGLGECPRVARIRAASPILDGASSLAGWLFFPLLALLLVVPPVLALLLWKVRSAYHWLYSSSVIKLEPPLATS